MRGMMMIAAGLTMLGMAGASPAENVMKACGARYQAAKTAKTLPAGKTWNQFLAECRAGSPAPATAVAPIAAAKAPVAAKIGAAPVAPKAVAAPAPAKVAAAPVAGRSPAAPVVGKPATAPSVAMAAMHDRQRKCGAMWQADKAAGKIPAGQTWPKYWSACNTRLKG